MNGVGQNLKSNLYLTVSLSFASFGCIVLYRENKYFLITITDSTTVIERDKDN